MKHKGLWILVLLVIVVALPLCAAMAAEADDPIHYSIEVTPTKLTGPTTVNVTITISNTGTADMQDPVILYAPNGKPVADFGTNGEAVLAAGDVKTWTGTWDVTQKQLESGYIYYYIKYNLYKENGEKSPQSQPIREKLSYQSSVTDIEIKRTITPGAARDGQTVTVKYDIVNTGTVALKSVTIQENKDIAKKAQTVDAIEPGKQAEIKFEVKMGKKDLTSKATVSYKTASSSKVVKQEVEAATIKYGEPAMTAKLTASAKGVPMNETVTLKLELKNGGTVAYSDLKVTDPTLGEVFTNQELEAKGSLTLEKEITLTQTTDYQFTITAIDNTGTEVSLSTDPLTVTAVDPDKVLKLELETSADRTEVYEQPGKVRFSVKVTNISEVDAKDVTIKHGDTSIYTFASIPAGESRSLTRDAALSMAGKYQFIAVTKDELGNDLSFKSNEVQIAFSIPTPAPATPTPPPVPTAEPTYQPVTVPPISNPAVAPVPKFIRNIFYPLMIVCGILLIGSLVLLAIATKRRADRKRASESAYDHLERAKRRDYVAPAEGEEPQEQPAAMADVSDLYESREENVKAQKAPSVLGGHDAELGDVELPHMKYVRNALQRKGEVDSSATDDHGDYYAEYGYDEPTLDAHAENPVPKQDASQSSPQEDDYGYGAYGSYDDYGNEYDEDQTYDDETYTDGSAGQQPAADDPAPGAYDEQGYDDQNAYDGQQRYDDQNAYDDQGYDPAAYDDSSYDQGYDETAYDEQAPAQDAPGDEENRAAEPDFGVNDTMRHRRVRITRSQRGIDA